jgi:adenosylcobinamide-phosphate synthase
LALKTGVFQGPLHKSPNAGYPEAAFSGALEIRLGGPNMYHGDVVEKPFIGKEFKDPENKKIKQACDLMMFGSLIATLLSCGIVYIFSG